MQIPSLQTAVQNRPASQEPKFGQIELGIIQDREGNDHGFLHLDLQHNPLRYYFTHQVNDTVLGPDQELVSLHRYYQNRNLSQPTVQSGFKTDLQKIVNRMVEKVKQSGQEFDEYSKQELLQLDGILNEPYGVIRRNPQGSYTMTPVNSDIFIRLYESAPLTGPVLPQQKASDTLESKSFPGSVANNPSPSNALKLTPSTLPSPGVSSTSSSWAFPLGQTGQNSSGSNSAASTSNPALSMPRISQPASNGLPNK